MSEVVLFHHVRGLTEGVQVLADALHADGHTVYVPDLLDGRLFASVEEGLAYVQELGFGAVIERGVAAVADLGPALVYLGISLGAMPAQRLAQTRPGAKGALLFESCAPVSEFGDAWPADVPVQVHGMDEDPIFAGEGDLDAARELVQEAKDGELFLYPGNAHLFEDSSLPTYDKEATELLTRRVLDFLAAHGANHG